MVAFLNSIIAFIDRNRVFLIFLALVIAQLGTWRAVISLRQAIESLEFTVEQQACGGSQQSSHPCRVVIEKSD